MPDPNPKVFISYSWSTPAHCECIRNYAERLVVDGIDVILDQWNLSEGQDKYVFMEKMVNDPSVTHVLIFSDDIYAKKADNREAGVGTETQIISEKLYKSIDQNKFIPIVCKYDDSGEPYLPTFLKSKIYINFSTFESVNENWEKLIRALYGKPIYQKPELGQPPAYIREGRDRPSLPTIGKFHSLRDAIISQRPTVLLCREDFLSGAYDFADKLRHQAQKEGEDLENQILDDLYSLTQLRDQVIDWLYLELSSQQNMDIEKPLMKFLNRFLPLMYPPPHLTSAPRIFMYELFIYIVALLINNDAWEMIRRIFITRYLNPDVYGHQSLVVFTAFGIAQPEVLRNRNHRLKLNRANPLADLIQERATRSDIKFQDIIQADILIALAAIAYDVSVWYPHTFIYSEKFRYPLFVRAQQSKDFECIRTMIGVSTGDELREKLKQGVNRYSVRGWHHFPGHAPHLLWEILNMDTIDTIK